MVPADTITDALNNNDSQVYSSVLKCTHLGVGR